MKKLYLTEYFKNKMNSKIKMLIELIIAIGIIIGIVIITIAFMIILLLLSYIFGWIILYFGYQLGEGQTLMNIGGIFIFIFTFGSALLFVLYDIIKNKLYQGETK
jgi:uncharacterized membrane protein